MNDGWIDLIGFLLFGGIAWAFLNRKKAKPIEDKLEIEMFPTSELSPGQSNETFEYWFRRQIELARLPFPSEFVPFAIVGLAALVLAITLLLTDDLVVAVGLSLATICVCLVSLVGAAAWKVRQFRNQLPLALDIMVGAVKSGESLQQSFRLLSTTMQEPAKTEFIRCRNQLDMGLSLRETMQSLANRIGTLDARMFAKILSVQRETGGHLTSTLQRLARVIRSRFEYEKHLQSTTGMGRMSVIVVVTLAWMIFGYIAIMKPDYGRALWEEPSGKRMLATALVLEVLGVLWALGLMRSRY